MSQFDYYSTTRQIAEYEKRRPKKYRNSGWKYCGVGYYRGFKYGRLLPETGYMYYTTQAWAVIRNHRSFSYEGRSKHKSAGYSFYT